MGNDKLKSDEKVKLDMSFDDAIDNMFENRNLDKNPERVIKINNDVLTELTNDKYKRLLTEILSEIRKTNLNDRLFALTPSPFLNILMPPITAEGYVEFRSKGIADDVMQDIIKIYSLSNIHLENI